MEKEKYTFFWKSILFEDWFITYNRKEIDKEKKEEEIDKLAFT